MTIHKFDFQHYIFALNQIQIFFIVLISGAINEWKIEWNKCEEMTQWKQSRKLLVLFNKHQYIIMNGLLCWKGNCVGHYLFNLTTPFGSFRTYTTIGYLDFYIFSLTTSFEGFRTYTSKYRIFRFVYRS
jgi:hypothetical protein